MKKAKIILASIAALALIGGAFAFKARTTIGKTYSWTNSYLQGTVTYRLPGNASFCINTAEVYVTLTRPTPTSPLTTTYITTAPNATITTLTAPGPLTKTIPFHTCALTLDVYTTINV